MDVRVIPCPTVGIGRFELYLASLQIYLDVAPALIVGPAGLQEGVNDIIRLVFLGQVPGRAAAAESMGPIRFW